MSLDVIKIKPEETFDWLMRIHYAKRIPQICHAFGLYEAGELMGVVTYGTPSAAPLRTGVAGSENAHLVLELNRLVLERPIHNGASKLVGASLRMLPKPSIVVSYADTAQGHVGYVYQACNFIYTGLSAKRTDWKVKGLEHQHSQTIVDMSKEGKGGERGSRAAFMREKFGDDFYLMERSRKHRYIFICAKGAERDRLLAQIRYPQEPYPKGETRRYAITDVAAKQSLLFDLSSGAMK